MPHSNDSDPHAPLTTERFWHVLAALERRLDDIFLGGEKDSAKSYRDLFESPIAEEGQRGDHPATSSFKEFLYRELGVHGGAFALLHESHDKIYLLQNSAFHQTLALEYVIDIPHMPWELKNETKEVDRSSAPGDMIDLMFLATRESQPLHPTEGGGGRPPEVLQHLSWTPRKDTSPSDSFELLPFESRLRASGFQGLYCTSGEVAFFTVAWRLLMRLLQSDSESVSMDRVDRTEFMTELDSRLETTPRPLWHSDRLSEVEQGWLESVEGFRNELRRIESLEEGQETRYRGFLASALMEWDNVRGQLDDLDPTRQSSRGHSSVLSEARPSARLLHDWKALGLIDDELRVTLAFRGMLGYVYHLLRTIPHPHVLRDQTIEDGGESTQHAVDPWVTLCQQVMTLIGFVRGAPSEMPRISELIVEGKDPLHLLARCVFRILDPLSASRSDLVPTATSQLLSRLHRASRVPIIPMFYWISLDQPPAPKEHFVFPVARSFNHSINVRVPTASGEENRCISQIAICLLVIRPHFEMQPTFDLIENGKQEYDEDSKITAAAFTRLMRISSFMASAAAPLVDYGFYAELEGVRLQLAATREQYAAQSHEIKYLIELINPRANVPPYALDLLRTYFRTLFATTTPEIEKYSSATEGFPIEYRAILESRDFADFTFRAAVLAAELQVLALAANRDREIPGEEIIKTRADSLWKRVDTSWNPLANTRALAGLPVKKKFFLFSALVCAFRNAYQHAQIAGSITRALSSDGQMLEIRNSRAETSHSGHPGSTKKGWLGSTPGTIEFYINCYLDDEPERKAAVRRFIELFRSNYHTQGNFVTSLPLPRALWEPRP